MALIEKRYKIVFTSRNYCDIRYCVKRNFKKIYKKQDFISNIDLIELRSEVKCHSLNLVCIPKFTVDGENWWIDREHNFEVNSI